MNRANDSKLKSRKKETLATWFPPSVLISKLAIEVSIQHIGEGKVVSARGYFT